LRRDADTHLAAAHHTDSDLIQIFPAMLDFRASIRQPIRPQGTRQGHSMRLSRPH
jgi:hypothetical protein